MSTEFDPLEQQLGNLRPARLPASARQGILREMQRPLARQRAAFWPFWHRAGLQVALAGALSLAVVMGSHWLPRSPRAEPDADRPALAASNALAFLEERVAAGSPIRINSVDEFHSPCMLTNTQIQR